MASIFVIADKTATEAPKATKKGIFDLETVKAPELDNPKKGPKNLDNKMRDKVREMCDEDFTEKQFWDDEMEREWRRDPEYWEECKRKFRARYNED